MNNTTYTTDNSVTNNTAPNNELLIKKNTSTDGDIYAIAMHKMAHEFGNALTLINSSLQIIESSHPEVQTYKYWSSTISDVQYLISLVSEVSLLGNSHKLRPTDTNITDILQSVVNSYAPKSLTENFSINFEIKNNIPVILADSTKLKQVFINLIKNAYEALDTSKPSFINIDLSANDTNILIDISDNGCGIPDEKISNIFTPMVSYKEYGTGLGLPISQKIIEAHNGTLTLESSYGKGTTFHIALPI